MTKILQDAMGLASMNPVVGSATGNAMLINTSIDKDLQGGGFGSYAATRTIDNSSIVDIDNNGKLRGRSKKNIDDWYNFTESSSCIYMVRTNNIENVWDTILKELALPYNKRPIHGPAYLYEIFTGHELYTPDQPDYDPLLEKVYLDKVSKQISGEADNIGRQFEEERMNQKDIHHPLEERKPYNGDYDQEDASIRFPLLAASTFSDGNSIENSLLSLSESLDQMWLGN